MKSRFVVLLGGLIAWSAAVAWAGDAGISAIDSPSKAKAAQAAWATKLNKPAQWSNSIGMKFQLIPPGEFEMGMPNGEPDAKPHKVRLTQPFYLGTYEVTREQWEKVTKKLHSNYFPGPQNPINYVGQDQAELFCALLNRMEGLSNAVYRLPTEAEWEYAARAGTATKYYTGDTEKDLDRAGWYVKNSGGMVHPVGQKEPNAFGLYDMLGNVWEWCQEYYDKDYYAKSPVDDPPGAKRAYPVEEAIIRGGSAFFDASFCTASHRDGYESSRSDKHFGFRVLLPIK